MSIKQKIKSFRKKYVSIGNKEKVNKVTTEYHLSIKQNLNIYKEYIKSISEYKIKLGNLKTKGIKNLMKFHSIYIDLDCSLENDVFDYNYVESLQVNDTQENLYENEVVEIENKINEYLKRDDLIIVKLEKINHNLQRQVEKLKMIKEELSNNYEIVNKNNESLESELYKLDKFIKNQKELNKYKLRKLFNKDAKISTKKIDELDLALIKNSKVNAKLIFDFLKCCLN